MHLVRTPRGNILLDCGLFQGRRKESVDRNQNLRVNPKDVEACINLTMGQFRRLKKELVPVESLRDAKEFTKEDIGALYLARWNIEVCQAGYTARSLLYLHAA